MTETRIAVLVGSLRADSTHRKVAELLRDHAPEGVVLDLVSDLDRLPFYEEQLDATDTPPAALALRSAVDRADAVLAVTPEYNGTMPAVLNNAIDWLSRPYGAGAIQGKAFGVLGTTPTPYGGKWAHEDAQRSAGIAGAAVVDGAIASQPALDVDPLTDTEVFDRFQQVIAALVAHQPVAA